MNEILRNLINEGKVATFVNNILVETETEKGHDEIVKEILKRLEENNFVTNFIQPYLHQFFIDSHSLNGYGKPLKRPFDRY